MKVALTDKALRSFKAPVSGRLEIADIRCPGLEFRVTSGGVQSWSFRFRDPNSGKPARATIGGYPAISLARARTSAEELRRQVSEGIHPVRQKQQQREQAVTRTFATLAERYMREHAYRRKKASSASEDQRNLCKHVLPYWADRPYDKITRRDVIELLERLVSAGTPTAANRVQAVISTVFSFAMDCDLLAANPAARLKKRGIERKRSRILSDDEIRLLWRGRCCRQCPAQSGWR